MSLELAAGRAVSPAIKRTEAGLRRGTARLNRTGIDHSRTMNGPVHEAGSFPLPQPFSLLFRGCIPCNRGYSFQDAPENIGVR